MTITKVCSKCTAEKPLDDFNKNAGRKDGLQSFCRECMRVHAKEYYHSNPKRHQVARLRSSSDILQRNRVYVWKHLEQHPCVDCGETDLVVLEFDHMRDKVCSVSKAITNCWTLQRIQEEIDKCEVRCANCHRRKTAKEANWNLNDYLKDNQTETQTS